MDLIPGNYSNAPADDDTRRHGTEILRRDMLAAIDEKRQRAMEALEEYRLTLASAAQAAYMDAEDRRNADVSGTQVDSALRVLWMD